MNNIEEIKTKVCTKCNNEKPLEEYHKSATKKHGINSQCKCCVKKRRKLGWEKIKNVKNEIRRNRYKNDEEYRKKVLAFPRKKRLYNNERRREYYKEYMLKKGDEVREYRKLKWIKDKPKYNEYRKQRRKNDLYFDLKCKLRDRVSKAIKRQKAFKGKRTLELLGCSVECCKKHIEALFKDGMTWENHGKFGWHIDHIKPCDAFDLTDPKQQEECFHYTNLQPLWWNENLSKGSSLFYCCESSIKR